MKTGGIQSNSMARCLTAIHHARQVAKEKSMREKNIVGVMPSRLNHLAPDCDAHAQQLLCLTLNDFTMNFYEYLSDAGRYHPSLHR